MNRQRFLLPAMLVLTVARLLFLPLHDLSQVERQALECSQRATLWQPGMGPVLPLLVKLGAWIAGQGPFGVRLFAPFLILFASWLLWETARGLFDATTASWALVLFQAMPVVNVASVTMTLTTLGILCSVLVLTALRQALHREYRWHLQWWMLGGTLVLSFFVEWRLFMLAVSGVAGLMLTQRGRRSLLKWPVLPVLGLTLGLAVTVFFAWNSEHGWTAFAPVPGMTPPTFGQLALHALLGTSPLLLLACGWSLIEGATRRPMEYPVAFLYAFTWPVVSLDVLSWMILPWPQCGYGAWIAPTCALLAHLAMVYDRSSIRSVIWTRRIVVAAAMLQSCYLLHRGLHGMWSLPW